MRMTKKEQKTIETNIRENMAKEKSIKAMLEKTSDWIDILAELKETEIDSIKQLHKLINKSDILVEWKPVIEELIKADTDSVKLLHQQLTERKFEMQKQLYSMRQYELDFKKS